MTTASEFDRDGKPVWWQRGSGRVLAKVDVDITPERWGGNFLFLTDMIVVTAALAASRAPGLDPVVTCMDQLTFTGKSVTLKVMRFDGVSDEEFDTEVARLRERINYYFSDGGHRRPAPRPVPNPPPNVGLE